MNKIRKISCAVLTVCFAMAICIFSTQNVSADTIEGKFYTFDSDTGVMEIFASVPGSGAWYQGPADGTVKEIVFLETEEDITIADDAFGNNAFRYLEKVTFSSSVKSIGDRAFVRGTFKLPDFEIVFPESGLESIGENAFSENHSVVETIELPSTVKSIGAGAFNGITMDYIQLPTSMEYLGPRAFEKTSYFNDLLGAGITCMDGAVYNKDMTSLIEYPYKSPTGEYYAPSTLKTIEKNAFYNTYGLKAVVLPEGFERIEDYGFITSDDGYSSGTYSTKYYTIIFPSTLEYIGTGCNFYGLHYATRYYRGTKEQAELVEDNSANGIFNDLDSDKWFFEYDIDDLAFPEEVTIKVGETIELSSDPDPVEGTTDAAKAGRKIAEQYIVQSCRKYDINDPTIQVIADNLPITGIAEGTVTANIQAYGRYKACVVHVSGYMPTEVGSIFNSNGQTYKVTSVSDKTVAFTAAADKTSVSVPKTITYAGQTYKVTQINAKAFSNSKATSVTIGANVKTIKKYAFKGSKVKKITVKTKKLKKSTVKGSLKSSKVTTVKVNVGNKKANKTYVKKYKKIFTKNIAGKKVTVK